MKDTIQEEILQQRGREYGSFLDNSRLVRRWVYENETVVQEINLKPYQWDEFLSLKELATTMMALKMARLHNAKSFESIKDCIIDFFNYWTIFMEGIYELTKGSFKLKFNLPEGFEHRYFIPGHNYDLIEQCTSKLKEVEWTNMDIQKAKTLADDVLDYYVRTRKLN